MECMELEWEERKHKGFLPQCFLNQISAGKVMVTNIGTLANYIVDVQFPESILFN